MRPIPIAVLAASMLLLPGCALNERTPRAQPSMITKVESYRAARESGDFDTARALLADDARVWYEQREGEGNPWRPGKGGRWSAWDKHFNSQSTPGPWHTAEHSVWRINREWNEYYDLIERTDDPSYRITYFFDADDAGKISGYMISAADPDAPKPPADAPRSDRFDEIEAWAKANHPDEWEYLRPAGKLDPTGDRPRRTRALINQWRTTVGLEPIE